MVRPPVVASMVLAIALGAPPAGALVWPDVPERIERGLSAPDPLARRVAAQELQSVGFQRGAPLVLVALRDPDVEVKLAAAQSAIRLHVTAATAEVLPWLGDREPRIRVAACDVARALPDARAVPQLARALGDSDAQVRAAAADALGSQSLSQSLSPSGTPGTDRMEAVAPLLGKLDDPSPPVRIQIVRALARLGDKRAVVPLVGKVQDTVPDVRQAVARALGDLGDVRAAQALMLELRDNVNDVRVEAMGALGRLKAPDAVDAIAPFAVERNATLRQAALAALGRIGTREAVRALVATLGFADDAGGGLERTPVREALVAAGPTSVPELSALLQGSPSPPVAASAAWVLGELRAQREAKAILGAMRRGVLAPAAALHALAGAGARDAVPVVLEFVGDPSPLVRGEAARAAAALLDPSQPDGRAVEPLAAALKNPQLAPPERAALAALLGRTGAPRAAPILAGLLQVKDPSLRLAAVDALGTLGPAGTDDALLERLTDADAAIRLHAAIALGDAGSARARDALLAKLEAGDELDRAAALTAIGGVLARLPSEAAVSELARSLELAAGPERDALLVALGRATTASALATLRRAAASADPDDRRTVAAVAAGQPQGASLARALLADSDATVRAQAAWALGTVGDASIIPLLEAAWRKGDPDVAANAAAAIGRIAARAKAPAIAARSLCPLLADPRAPVRANALAGLAAAGARCGDGAAERRILEGDPSDLARAAAASLVARASTSPDDRAALDRCAATDRAGVVARRCRPDARASAPPGVAHAVEVYVVPESSTAPRPRVAYAMELADGLIRVGVADRRGAVFDPRAPDGDVTLKRVR